MAWLSRDARDIPPDKKLVCHKRKCGTVVCLLCSGGWCKTDFNKIAKAGKGFYISQNIMVCPTHGHITYNLFDNLQVNDNPEITFAQRKLTILNKHIECIQNGTVVC